MPVSTKQLISARPEVSPASWSGRCSLFDTCAEDIIGNIVKANISNINLRESGISNIPFLFTPSLLLDPNNL
jgi:hypothetical protein